MACPKQRRHLLEHLIKKVLYVVKLGDDDDEILQGTSRLISDDIGYSIIYLKYNSKYMALTYYWGIGV